MPIVELGHVGLFTDDLANLSDFYREVLGLFHTDGSVDAGIIFLSSRPSFEHHELVLVQRRDGEGPKGRVNQVSWRVDTLADLLTLRQRIVGSGAAIQQEVTHGNAIAVYFYDPEGNRLEVYWQTGLDVPQPFLKPLALDKAESDVMSDLADIVGAPPNKNALSAHAGPGNS